MLLGIIFLNTELKKPQILTDEMIIIALLAINKAKHVLNKLFSCSCSDIIYRKSIKKNRKKVPFLKVYHFSISQHFPIVKAVVVQAAIPYFNKKISWHQIVNLSNHGRNKVPNFPSLFSKYFA